MHSANGRALSTAIYFLVTAASPSRMHRVTSDEIWHFYAGDPLEMLQLEPGGASKIVLIGSRLTAGERPQVLVPAGTWQGARMHRAGEYALVGATVTPGFDFDDFTLRDRALLTAKYPTRATLIEALT